MSDQDLVAPYELVRMGFDQYPARLIHPSFQLDVSNEADELRSVIHNFAAIAGWYTNHRCAETQSETHQISISHNDPLKTLIASVMKSLRTETIVTHSTEVKILTPIARAVQLYIIAITIRTPFSQASRIPPRAVIAVRLNITK